MSNQDSLEVSATIAATVEVVFDAFLDGAQHSAMTGSEATSVPEVGTVFTAWEGYISGKQLSFERPSRIVQAWRAADFPAGAKDSRLEIHLAPTQGGTRVTFVHTEIPTGMGPSFRDGWMRYYLEPMAAYFEAQRE